MTGTAKKISSRTVILAANVGRGQDLRIPSFLISAIVRPPPVTESRIIDDRVEVGVRIAEFLANPLDESTHVLTESLRTLTGGKSFAANEIVNFSIGHVLAGAPGHGVRNL